jgi:hypothetical protein
VAVRDRRLVAAFREGDELIAQIDERHAAGLSTELEVEYPAVPLERLLEVSHLERDVVDADQPRHSASVAG